MNTTLIPTTPETVIHATVIGTTAVVYAKSQEATDGVRIRTVKCHTYKQAQAVSRFWQAVAYPESAT
jgi:hypothetical protein